MKAVNRIIGDHRLLAIMVALGVAFLKPSFAVAQGEVVAGVAAGAAASLTVGNVIEKARSSVQSLIDGGYTQSNAWAVNRAVEMNLLIMAASREFERALDTPVSKLTEESGRLITALRDLTDQAKNLPPTVAYIRDTTVVDVRLLLGPKNLAGSFFVQKVYGITQLQTEDAQDYRVTLLGSFGPDSDESMNTYELQIAGKAAPFRMESTRAGETTFVMEPSVLNQHFNARRLAIAKMDLTVHRKVKKGWLFHTWSENKYVVPLYLALVPRFAGIAHIVVAETSTAWVKTDEVSNYTLAPDRNCTSNCGGEPTMGPTDVVLQCQPTCHIPPAIGDCRLVNPQWIRGREGSCAFSDTRGFVSENPSVITVKSVTWGKPCTVGGKAERQVFTATGENRKQLDVDVYFGRIFEIPVPSNFAWGRLTVVLSTHETVELMLGANDPTGQLKLEADSGPGSPNRRLFYRLAQPQVNAVPITMR